MNFRSITLFFILVLSLAGAGSIFAQTPQTTVSVDTKTDTSKHHFTLKTLGMSPVYDFESEDNAKINMARQFQAAQPLAESFHFSGESHLKNIVQLTFEGENTSPTISADDRLIAFEARGTKSGSCDQIYTMMLTGGPARRISTGGGEAADPAFFPDNEVLYSSTQSMYQGACPPNHVSASDTLWPLPKAYDLYVGDESGKVIRQITFDTAFYDGSATVSPNGNRIVFTTMRLNGIDVFAMNDDGGAPKRLTFDEGYNGGARFSADGRDIVFCGSHPLDRSLTDFRAREREGAYHPDELEIYSMDSGGSNRKQLTYLHAVSFAPIWSPDGKHIVFCSNYGSGTERQEFDLFSMDRDGGNLTQLTFGGGFNGFPVFTHDGKRLVFVSARNASQPGDRNLFIADWEQ